MCELEILVNLKQLTLSLKVEIGTTNLKTRLSEVTQIQSQQTNREEIRNLVLVQTGDVS